MSTETPSPPLFQLLDQVNLAAANGLHLIAIAMAVALPDICSALAAHDGRAHSHLYKAWCAANLTGSKFSAVTPEDLYSMRCGVLHQGRFGDIPNTTPHTVARVVFMPPGVSTLTNCKLGDAYVYNVVEFCKNMCDAVLLWYEANTINQNVKLNMKRMMQYYPDGLFPYTNVPTIA